MILASAQKLRKLHVNCLCFLWCQLHQEDYDYSLLTNMQAESRKERGMVPRMQWKLEITCIE